MTLAAFLVWLSAGGPAASVPPAPQSAPTPTVLPSEQAFVRLTVIGPGGRENSVFDFGPATAGRPVTHVFTLRNDTASPVVLDRLDPSCGCTGATLLDETPGAQPHLLPGATARVRITLDTAKLTAAADTAPGGAVAEEVSVFLAGQPVHAAAVLRLSGRLTRGVAFDPPVLNLGDVEEGRGATRLVHVTYDTSLYAPGRTRLATPPDGRVTVQQIGQPQADAPGAAPSATGPVRRTYRVTVPPHAAIGLLSGALAVTGVASCPSLVRRTFPTGAFQRHGRAASPPHWVQ